MAFGQEDGFGVINGATRGKIFGLVLQIIAHEISHLFALNVDYP
jgi:hypothetical protein